MLIFKGLRFSAVDSLIPTTLAFCAGITWANFAVIPISISWIVIVLLAIRLIVLRHNSTITSLILLAFFFMIGGIHGSLALRPPNNPHDISAQIKFRQEVSIIGTLAQAPSIKKETTSLLMATEQIITPKRRDTVSGLVKLAMRGRPAVDLEPGEHFIALAQLAPVSGYDVPGAFDYQKYLAYQGIRISGWISSPLLIKKVTKIPADTLWTRISNTPELIRQRLGQQLNKFVPAEAGIYQALLIGERAGLSQETKKNFKACGIVHLLAISGIHMGLLALAITFTITWLLKRSQWILLNIPITKTAALLSLPPLLLYALIAGFHPPAVRALIMVTVFIGALVVNRQWSIINNTAVAALLILSINPALLYTASFQLSFAAIISIALFVPYLSKIIKSGPFDKDHRPKIGRRLFNWCLFSILISIIAMAGTAPILVYHFNQISLISPLATLLVEPLLCLWSLIWGLLGSLCLAVPALAAPLFKIGALGIVASVKITSFLAAWPVSIWLPSPTWLQILSWLTALILLSFYLKRGNTAILAGIFLCLIFFIFPISVRPQSYVHGGKNQTLVDILNVGHGSASILQLPGGHTIIIDGGKRQSGRYSSFNVGKDLIAPFLWHQQIRTIDAIIITHPHADHYNGLPFIIRKFAPKTLWINNSASDEKQFRDLLALTRQLKITIKSPPTGETLYQDGSIKLTVLANLFESNEDNGNHHQSHDAKRNNQGLVLRLQDGQRSFLFTGDIEKSAEKKLLSSRLKEQLKADVLIVPHHGSRTSSSPNFIRAVAPYYAIISAEKNSHGKFPASEVIKGYEKIGAQVINTARNGSIFFSTNGINLRRISNRGQFF